MAMEDLQDILIGARVKFASRKTLFIVGGGIALLALLIILLLLAVIILGTRDCGETTIQDSCMEPVCYQSASYVTKNRDVTVNPCDDFYKYACQGWLENVKDGLPSPLHHLAWDNQQKRRTMLENRLDVSEEPTSEKKVKDFFNLCAHDFGRNNDGAEMVDAILTNLGGWYVLDPQNWNVYWNMERAVANANVEFLAGIFFHYYLKPDPMGVVNNIMRILPENIGMHRTSYTDADLASIRTAYKTYIKTVGGLLLRDANVTLTPSERNSRLETFANDVIGHEGRLAQYNFQYNTGIVRTTLGELAKNYTQIPWVEIVSSIFPRYSSSTAVEAENLGYFRLLDNVLREEGLNRDRILNNFMVWSIVNLHIQNNILSLEYQKANCDFRHPGNVALHVVNNWEYCLDMTQYRLTPAMIAMFVRRQIGEKSSFKNVEKLVDDLRSFAIKRVDGLKWMDDQTKAIAKYKLSNMEVLVGLPKLVKDADKFNALYDQLKLNWSVSFFKNMLYVNEFLRYENSKMEDYKDSLWMWSRALSNNELDVVPFYFEAYNTMLVPAGSMSFPVYDSKMSKAMVYGGIGRLIAKRLVHVFDLEGRNHLNGTGIPWWTKATKAAYDDAAKCLSDFGKGKKAGPYLLYGGQKTVVDLDGHILKPEDIAEIYGLQIAFQAYQANAMNTPQQLLPGVNLTKQQLFFVSAAQLQCIKRPDDKSFFRLREDGYLPTDILVNWVMAQNPDFHEAFNCPDNSLLKPKTFCSLV